MSCGCRGVGIVAVLMIVLILSLIGGVVTALVAAGAIAKTNDLVSEQAFALITAGAEYSFKRLDDGFNPNGDVKTLGNGQFSIGYDGGTGLITVTSDVSAMRGQANPQYTIQGPTGGGMDECLDVDVNNAYLAYSNTRLRGINIENTCNAVITISSMTVSWTSPGSERMNRIRMGGTNVYNNPTGVVSGTSVDIADYSLPACSSSAINYFRFNSSVADKNFTIQFHMSDGTTKQAFVQFVADDEAACLNVDLSATYIGGTGFRRVLSGTLTNECDPPIEITISGMRVSWTPTTPARRMNAIQISGNGMEWTGSAGSGATAGFSSPVDLDAGQTRNQLYLQFNNDIRGRNFTLVYLMSDGTEKSVPLNLYEADMSACISVNTAGASLTGGRRNLVNTTWQNTCPLRIVVARVRTNWSGVPGSRRLQQIRVNGSTVWNGWANSGTNVDINDVEITGGSTVPVNRYRFNSNMSGACFTHRLTMFDGGSFDVPSYCP